MRQERQPGQLAIRIHEGTRIIFSRFFLPRKYTRNKRRLVTGGTRRARPDHGHLTDQRREIVELPFGSIKQWMNQGAFLMASRTCSPSSVSDSNHDKGLMNLGVSLRWESRPGNMIKQLPIDPFAIRQVPIIQLPPRKRGLGSPRICAKHVPRKVADDTGWRAAAPAGTGVSRNNFHKRRAPHGP
jgi:hypothetical protein